ncbi:type 1 glutamine amidotransferase domain-containing protein [Stappia sp. ES.058]|uniref:type 1 glutamine amidotransferase domain-containing protein n=1 Tax=Stappia sp. ES.058 TaxID=1881061 RepID=UPI00087A6E0F|nr:type 1 glutamine amidotransferase domain-containing protein [Stappia sp. ES.058]SDU07823.1 Putative intracellular protease/amidase [Stappia sp. ES.058]
MSNTPRILMIATSAATMAPSDEPTGVWLEELTTPYYAFRDAGAEVTLASIAGGAIPVDARSVKPRGENDATVERYYDDAELMEAASNTPRFDTLDVSGYDAVFLPGGHGTMFDYPKSDELARLVADTLDAGKIMAAVCHGPAGLVNAKRKDGTAILAGRKVAGFTDSEERAVGLDTSVPFLLETRLRELGSDYVCGPDFEPFAVRDGALVTGQNPASAGKTADLVLEALSHRKAA